MEKTALDKRIHERAEERFNAEFKGLVDYLSSHPIFSRLQAALPDVGKISLVNFGTNRGLLNATGLKNSNSHVVNLAEVKEELLKKYIQEETDNLLKKLEGLEYLFR
jgi:hypothetical protein